MVVTTRKALGGSVHVAQTHTMVQIRLRQVLMGMVC